MPAGDPRVRTESRGSGAWRDADRGADLCGCCCLAARPLPSAGRRGSWGPLCCGQAASARSPHTGTAHAPCTSSFSRRGQFVSSELIATPPSSLLDSKPPRACSTSWRQLHICRDAGHQWREREEANVGGTHQGSRPTWL